jgi:tetratricopeptide (TPR) repeat protein
VNLTSRPFFSAKATNSPALEVGPATLTFLRNEAGGGIVMLGDRALSLPNSISLAPDGRSVRPLAFVFSYDPARNEAVLSLDGSSYALAATQRSAQLEVAVSAGAEAAWTINTLEVTSSGGATGLSLAAGGSSSGSPSADQAQARGPAIDREQAFIEARDNFAAGQDEKALAALAAGNSRKKSSPTWPMANAQALVRLAMEFSSQGRTATADRIAQKALQAIDRVVAQASAAEGDLAADAQELAGLIKLRFLGDAAAARASYREALRFSPLNTAAKESLGRLEQSETEVARKGRSHGGI